MSANTDRRVAEIRDQLGQGLARARDRFEALRQKERAKELVTEAGPSLDDMLSRISLNLNGIVYGYADEALVNSGLPHALRSTAQLS